MKWEISDNQKKLLDKLFSVIGIGKVNSVLDMGSGRTSIDYLTDKFKKLTIRGVVYPEDQERILKIKNSVKRQNYELVLADIKDFNKKENYDIVLAHLFLGEATKYVSHTFEEILDNLFEIKAKYLVIVNVSYDDSINYFYLLKKIAQAGEVVRLSFVESSKMEFDPCEKFGGGCIGMTIKKLK